MDELFIHCLTHKTKASILDAAVAVFDKVHGKTMVKGFCGYLANIRRALSKARKDLVSRM